MSSGNASFLEGSFDYRSLLPTRNPEIQPSPSGDQDDDDMCACLPEMSLRERLLGCGTCMIAGYLLSFGSFWRIKDLVIHHDPLPFVVCACVCVLFNRRCAFGDSHNIHYLSLYRL